MSGKWLDYCGKVCSDIENSIFILGFSWRSRIIYWVGLNLYFCCWRRFWKDDPSQATNQSNNNSNRRPAKMPLPQSLHRISTKVRKIILFNKHYRLRVQDSQNPSNPCADNLEKPATIYKSKERGRGIKRINHNIWRPLKLKYSIDSNELIRWIVLWSNDWNN